VNAIGHNERSYRLDVLAEEARKGLASVAQGEDDTLAGWLAYGHALNEGRALFPADRQFGEWVQSANLAEWNGKPVHDHDRAAAMWAAANSDQFDEARAAGSARTVRGIHAKWKEIEAERQRQEEEARRAAEAQENIGRVNPEPETVAGAQSSLPVADESGGVDTKPGVPAEETPAQEPDQAAQTGDTGGGKADAAPDPHAKERRALSGLSREGLEDEVIGLRAALAEERAAHRDTKAKLKQARETIKNHTADDKDEVIRRLSGDVKAQQNARFQAEEKFAAEKRKTFVLSKRVKELESMGIAL
jgi:hypothetical protein